MPELSGFGRLKPWRPWGRRPWGLSPGVFEKLSLRFKVSSEVGSFQGRVEEKITNETSKTTTAVASNVMAKLLVLTIPIFYSKTYANIDHGAFLQYLDNKG